MNATFACPACDQPSTVSIDHAHDWQCQVCHHRLSLSAAEPTLPVCVLCGNRELYKRKDFPQWLGMSILIAACILSTLTYYWYEKWWTWSFLIGSALIDGILYLMVSDVVICYRCESHYRGLPSQDTHHPFELGIGERYRQEKIRLEKLQGKNSTA